MIGRASSDGGGGVVGGRAAGRALTKNDKKSGMDTVARLCSAALNAMGWWCVVLFSAACKKRGVQSRAEAMGLVVWFGCCFIDF